jgi:hypothetical protein
VNPKCSEKKNESESTGCLYLLMTIATYDRLLNWLSNVRLPFLAVIHSYVHVNPLADKKFS